VSLAREFAECHDQELVRIAFATFDGMAAKGRIKNPTGAIRTMVQSPGEWGIEKTAEGWQPPSDAQPEPAPVDLVALEEKIRRERAERQKREADYVGEIKVTLGGHK